MSQETGKAVSVLKYRLVKDKYRFVANGSLPTSAESKETNSHNRGRYQQSVNGKSRICSPGTRNVLVQLGAR